MPDRLRPDRLFFSAALFVASAVLILITTAAAAPQAQNPPTEGVWPLSIAWATALGAPAAAGPAYDDSRAYVAVRAGDETPAALVAVSLVDGAIAWRIELAEVDSVAAGDGLVYAAVERTIRAYDSASGAPAWEFHLAAPTSAPLLHAAGWLVACTSDAKVVALRAREGTRVWVADVPAPVVTAPAVSANALYLGHKDNRVSAMWLDSGALAWRTQLAAEPNAMLPLDDRIFVGTKGRWFYALHPKGGVAWRVGTGAEVVGVPVVDDTRVYFISLANLLRGLDRGGGYVAAQHVLGRRAFFGPYHLGELIAVSGRSTTIEAYAPRDLKRLAAWETPHDLTAPLHVVRGLVPRDVLLVSMTGEGEVVGIRPAAMTPR